MKINRLKLINDVSKALPGIATGTIVMDGADSLVFLNGHIYSYNSAISVNVEESEETGLKGIVNAQDFYNCIMKLPSDEIELEVTDSTWNIKDGKIKVSMKLLPENGILERFQKLVPGENWLDIDGKDFNSALKVCLIKGDSSSLSGVYFKDNIALATNKWVINKYSLKNEYPEFWVSSSGVAELVKWNNFEKIQFEKQWLHLKSSDDTVFSVRTLALENYPFEKILSIFDSATKKNAALSLKLTEGFFKAIQRAAFFSNKMEEHEVISISFGKEVSIKGSRISGNYEECVSDMETSLESPIEMMFDVEEFTSSEKFFDDFEILSDEETIDTDSPVHVILKNENCIKLFNTITESDN